EPLRRQRRGTMLVDDTTRGGLVCRSQRGHRFRDVVVHQRLEIGPRVFQQERVDEQKELRLPLVEVAHDLQHQGDVALLLPHDDPGRMLARAHEPGTIARTRDLGQPLGAAADRTDLLADCGTAPPGATISAERADHSTHYCIIRAKTSETHRNAPCSPAALVARAGWLYE